MRIGEKLKTRDRIWSLLLIALLGATSSGCVNAASKQQGSSASTTSQSSTIKSSSTSSSSSFSSQELPVGKILSVEDVNPNIAYRVADKQATFYWSLKGYGKKSDIASDNATAQGLNFGAFKKYVTTKGIYYHMVSYNSGGFEKEKGWQRVTNYADDSNFGYINANNVRRFYTVTSKWTYQQKKPYYVANPYSHRIWNQPVYTVRYTFVSHVFDRLATTQLYATKELIKHTGAHYVYLETAGGKKLGWVYKSPKVLIAGKYRDPGKQLLHLKSGEKKAKHVQSVKSTKSRVGVNDSLAMPQRAYVVKNKQKQVKRVLVLGMDNRPTKIYFKNGHAIKEINYTYRRKIWKVTTNKKKLRTHFTARHTYITSAETRTNFYSSKSKKLARVMTIGDDGIATTTIYRSGHIVFKTSPFKEIITYPYANFK